MYRAGVKPGSIVTLGACYVVCTIDEAMRYRANVAVFSQYMSELLL